MLYEISLPATWVYLALILLRTHRTSFSIYYSHSNNCSWFTFLPRSSLFPAKASQFFQLFLANMFSNLFSILIAQEIKFQSTIYPSQFCMFFEGSGYFPEDINYHFTCWGHCIPSRQPNITLSFG